MGTSARSGEAKRQAERRALKAAAEVQPAKPPSLQNTFRVLDAVSDDAVTRAAASNSVGASVLGQPATVAPDASARASPSASCASLLHPDASTATDNWRKRKKAKEAEIRPREIADDESNPNLTPAQRTMARLRRRAMEREMQQDV